MTHPPYAGSPVDPFIDHRSFRPSDPARYWFKAGWAAADDEGVQGLNATIDYAWDVLLSKYDVTLKQATPDAQSGGSDG